MKLGLFVSGTDTGVGKTIVSSLMLSALKSLAVRTGYFKPIQTGTDLDTPRVAELTEIPLSKFPNPVYSLAMPAAPSRAASAEGIQIQLDLILKAWNELDDRAWVVEGAGGLLVPLNQKQTIRDLIQILGLRLLLVASTRLGTLNHTLLTIEAARTRGIEVRGIVLVGDEDPGLEKALSSWTEIPILTRIPQAADLSPTWIQENGPKYFSSANLKWLYD